MKIEDPAPIALFVYNRPWHTSQTLNALKLNSLASKSDLIVFSDAPKNTASINLVNEVRKIVATTVGFKSIKVIERNENFGLAKSIIDGVSKICNEAGRVIVLEDDLVTSPYFLQFMNDALTLYEAENKVVSVHGYIYPVKKELPDTFFLRGADCWGWATWKRGWDVFETDGEKLLSALNERRLGKAFNFGNTHDYTGMLRDQIEGRVNSWAVRWYASAFLADKLTLYPGVSLVQNIGNDSSGTHFGTTDQFDVALSVKALSVENIKVEQNNLAWEAVAEFFRATRRPLWRRIASRVKRKLVVQFDRNS